jgi:hypothetical protein
MYMKCLYQGGLTGNTDNDTTERLALNFTIYNPDIIVEGTGGAVEVGYTGVSVKFIQNIGIYSTTTGEFDNAITTGGLPNGVVNCVKRNPINGYIYACGNFTSIGGVAANRIAYWDGAAWNAMGVGCSGEVFALAFDATGNVYAGSLTDGDFGGIATSNGCGVWSIAGAAWAALGTGLKYAGEYINDICCDSLGRMIYVGKWNAGGVFPQIMEDNINLWDGVTWRSGYYGGPLEVSSVVSIGNFIYFSVNDGIHSEIRIGNSLGSDINVADINGIVNNRCMVKDENNNLYAGGAFTTVNGVAGFGYILKYDGAVFSKLSSGLSSAVNGLTTDGAGNLYVSSGINLVMQKWNGSVFTTIPSYLKLIISGMAFYNGIIYFCGTVAGGTRTITPNTSSVSGENYFSYPVARLKGALNLYSITINGKTTTFNTTSKILSNLETAKLDYNPKNFLFIKNNGSNLISKIDGSSSIDPMISNLSNSFTVVFDTAYTVYNDDSSRLSELDGITGITTANSDNYILYITMTYAAPNYSMTIYKNAARGAGDVVATVANHTTTGQKSVVPSGGSGLGGYINHAVLVASTDSDIYVQYTIPPVAVIQWDRKVRSLMQGLY